MLRRAFGAQTAGAGFSFVEILTMCPTGWFIETPDAPAYLSDNLAAVRARARRPQGHRRVSDSNGPGPIVTVLGPYTDGVLPVLRQSAPSEVFSPTPTRTAEIVVTLTPDPTDLETALTSGVRWVHVLGTGVDDFPVTSWSETAPSHAHEARRRRRSPNGSFATMLAFAKRLPESWVKDPPALIEWGRPGELAGIHAGCDWTRLHRRRGPTAGAGLRHPRRRRPPEAGAVANARGGGRHDLDQVLAIADHLVVAAPATADTRHLIGSEALATMKPGVHLVNVARGRLIDQGALRQALDSGHVAMASLDVVEPEPLPAGHWLYRHPRVRLSPHISWSTPGSQLRTLQLFVDELDRYRSGQLFARPGRHGRGMLSASDEDARAGRPGAPAPGTLAREVPLAERVYGGHGWRGSPASLSGYATPGRARRAGLTDADIRLTSS